MDVRGQFLESFFFFGGGTRAGFAIYERGASDAFKRCIRAEARFVGEAPITMELDDTTMAEFVAVMRGSRQRFEKTIKRRGQTPKHLAIYYNAGNEPPNAWVLRFTQGAQTVKVAFDSGVAWRAQHMALTMLAPLYPDMSDACLWQILSATGRAAP